MKLTIRTNELPENESQGRAQLDLDAIPSRGAFDVVVVGGGTAGGPAAIAAGQEGLKTAVIEPQSFLGGIGTGGGIHSYYHGIQTGLQFEIDKRNDEWNRRIGGKVSGFHPEAKKLALQEMADEAGVRCFYRAFFVGVLMDGKALRGIVAEDAEGLFSLEAKVVIDGTGDGDVAAAAGAPFLFGREGDYAPQPYSLAPGVVRGGDFISFHNFDAGYVDPTNARDFSRAHLESRGHLYREKYEAGNRILYISPILGLRESRFIDAEYVLTLADQQQERRFPDVIARGKAHYDNHALDYENESAEARLWVSVLSNWRTQMCHDIPYRSLLPKKVENLLVACRASGMTHDAHHLLRMQRDMQALGEAAAVAAAQSISSKRTVRDIDVKKLQQRLVERKALPPEALDGKGLGSIIPADQNLATMGVPELLNTFGSGAEPAALREFLRRGKTAHAGLRAALKSDSPNTRLLAAIALGAQGLADGSEILKQALAARRPDTCDAHRTSPRWIIALYLLDKLGLHETDSLDLVLALLKDKQLNTNVATAAVRALGRCAPSETICSAVRAVLRRSDIDGNFVLQHSMGDRSKPIIADRRFELELAAAEVLAKNGAHEEAARLAGKHAKDSRSLVRDYARKLLAAVQEPALAK